MPTSRLLRFTLFFLAGCLSLSAQRSGDTRESEATTSGDYILQPLDLLQMRVFQEPEMERDVRVSQEYAISLPLVGKVNVKGLTVREAETLVTELYNRDYLVNPQINITVMEYARRTVKVLGAVGAAGEIQFPQEEGLTLLDAVTRAGGFTRLADRRRIKLTRRLADGTQETYIVNADDLIEGNASQIWTLRTNDLIYVPERLL